MSKLLAKLKGWARTGTMRPDFRADGVGVKGKNLSFMDEPRFANAWSKAKDANSEGWSKSQNGVPDVRWRAHVCCWAANHGLSLPGDFVECGVHTGLLSVTVAHYLAFERVQKRFWLFDTFAGIPDEELTSTDKEHATLANDSIYFDVFQLAQRNFADFPNATLVRGVLPGTLAEADIERISYLSIDLNVVGAERAVINELWSKLTPGAIVVLDDYAFRHHEEQYAMWNSFASQKGKTILTVPTGQGLLIR